MLFISGRLALDFAHSGGEGRFAAFERLHTPGDLSRWFELSQLRLHGVAAAETDLAGARELRRAVWDAANAVRLGDQPQVADIATVNRFAALAPPVPVLGDTGGVVSWTLPEGAGSALSAVARDAIDLFSRASEVRIKQCENPACPLLFVDASRAGKRRWCAMERCGNMTKVARHRSKASADQRTQ